MTPVLPPVAEKTYTLGRHPDNDICLDKPQVSGHHATLTVVSESLMLLQDNDSTNGTYVNDFRIRRALIDPNDKILLGNLPIDLTKLFAHNRPAHPTPEPASSDQTNDFGAAFLGLKAVHEGYREARKSLENGEKLKLVGRAVLFFIPHIGMPIGMLMSGFLTNTEKLEALDRGFQLKYICPKCKRYLGNVYWETLANQKRCGCGAIWVAD